MVLLTYKTNSRNQGDVIKNGRVTQKRLSFTTCHHWKSILHCEGSAQDTTPMLQVKGCEVDVLILAST